MSERPAPPARKPNRGTEWVPTVVQGWRLTSGKRCSSGAGRAGGRGCSQPAVAERNASSNPGRSQWRPYCEQHLAAAGRWIEDGQVMTWALRKVTGSDG